MSTPICQCIPCYVGRASYPITTAEEASVTQYLPTEMLHYLFRYFDTNSLLRCSLTCTRWRFVATAILAKNSVDRAYSTPCFQPFYDDFYASRHLFILDVSPSMSVGMRKENARIIYDKITQFIEPVIKKRGVYVCKFGLTSLLRYYNTSQRAKKFVDTASKLPTGSNLSAAVEAVVNTILEKNSSDNSHVHIISDMEVVLDESILSSDDLHALPSKITFHYYDAAKNPESDFLKRIQSSYVKLKDALVTEPVKRYSDSVEFRFYGQKQDMQSYSSGAKDK